jgi:hypothetical protein
MPYRFVSSPTALFILCVLLASCTTRPTGPAPPAVDSPVSAQEIRAHLEFLADDLLEGREAGTRGYDLAAKYVAAQFAAAGFEPAGSNGTYFQPVTLRKSTLVIDSVSFSISKNGSSREFVNGSGVAIFSSPTQAEQQITAPLTFAGHGIVAPEFGLDDYAGLDVRGHVVAVLGGPPAHMPGEAAAHYGSPDQQRRAAAERGALGVMIIYTPAMEARFSFARQLGQLPRTDVYWVGPDGKPREEPAEIRLRALLDTEAAEFLLDGAPQDLNSILETARTRPPKGFPLNARVSVSRKSRHETGTSSNVVGFLRGSDPELANEIVLLSGHLDHVGMGPPEKGDRIYNGAMDNAIGISSMLEIARVLAASPARPRRSILLVAVTAEEKGLIGSDYYAHHPTVPIERIVANVNLDGALPFYEFVDVIAFGAEHSTLESQVREAAESMGLTVSPDPFPELGIFTRSDHYSFVRQGIPSFMLLMGMGGGANGRAGREAWDNFSTRHLHRPSDDLNQPIDYRVTARFAEVYRRITLNIANAEAAPLWYEGDVFGDRFAPGKRKAPRPVH